MCWHRYKKGNTKNRHEKRVCVCVCVCESVYDTGTNALRELKHYSTVETQARRSPLYTHTHLCSHNNICARSVTLCGTLCDSGAGVCNFQKNKRAENEKTCAKYKQKSKMCREYI